MALTSSIAWAEGPCLAPHKSERSRRGASAPRTRGDLRHWIVVNGKGRGEDEEARRSRRERSRQEEQEEEEEDDEEEDKIKRRQGRWRGLAR